MDHKVGDMQRKEMETGERQNICRKRRWNENQNQACVLTVSALS